MTPEELFVKHFNGVHYEDITAERIIKYAIEYAKIYHNIEVKKLKSNNFSGSANIISIT